LVVAIFKDRYSQIEKVLDWPFGFQRVVTRQWLIYCGEADTSTYSEEFYVWLAVNLEDHMLLIAHFVEAEARKALQVMR
jgi:hypothetical protein